MPSPSHKKTHRVDTSQCFDEPSDEKCEDDKWANGRTYGSDDKCAASTNGAVAGCVGRCYKGGKDKDAGSCPTSSCHENALVCADSL